MSTKQLIFFASFLSLMGMNACTNGLEDMDVLDLKSDPFILRENTLSLDNLSDETERQMTNSMLRLKSKKMLDISKSSLSANDFFGTGQACFPAYKESMAHFELYPYDSLRNDTLMFHNRMDYLEEYVDSILNDDFDYYVYVLTWKSKGQEFNTIALYDSNDGLVYDNILFNIIELTTIKRSGGKRILSRTENVPGGYYASGSDFVELYDASYCLKGQIFFSWYEYGHMGSAPVHDENGNIIQIVHFYVHDSIFHYSDKWADSFIRGNNNTNDSISIINKFKNFSTAGASQFMYCLWIGPSSLKPNVDPYFQYFFPHYNINFSYIVSSGPFNGCSIGGVLDSPYFQQPGYTEDL